MRSPEPVLTRSRVGRTAVVAVGLTLLAVSGCASPTESSNRAPDLLHRLPKEYQQSREILVGSDFRTPPLEYRGEAGVPTGMEVDLATAISEQLGVRFKFVDTPFDGLIRGLNAKTYDMILSGMTDTPERQAGTQQGQSPTVGGVDFVDYFMAGSAVVTAKGNPKRISSFDDLCGKSVALRSGTIYQDFTERQSQYCSSSKANKSGIVIEPVQSEAEAFSAVASGRADATMTDYPVAVYQVRTVTEGAGLELAVSQIRPKPYGMAVRKGDNALAETLVKAVDRLISSGTYEAILKKWHVEQGAVYSALINSADN
ncbi:ABC transporter substrate-binding protein [Kitasatospora sp. NPDC059571]|uniref:ABC transporter substrate-binding protein n=1 Tax=Kitasatospora sp. NPDC059571 TaxID=3346871 RepID=UPI003677D86A